MLDLLERIGFVEYDNNLVLGRLRDILLCLD